ncbi:unnamed protein product, partial [Phaeothamnion confervicola]
AGFSVAAEAAAGVDEPAGPEPSQRWTMPPSPRSPRWSRLNGGANGGGGASGSVAPVAVTTPTTDTDTAASTAARRQNSDQSRPDTSIDDCGLRFFEGDREVTIGAAADDATGANTEARTSVAGAVA